MYWVQLPKCWKQGTAGFQISPMALSQGIAGLHSQDDGASRKGEKMLHECKEEKHEKQHWRYQGMRRQVDDVMVKYMFRCSLWGGAWQKRYPRYHLKWTQCRTTWIWRKCNPWRAHVEGGKKCEKKVAAEELFWTDHSTYSPLVQSLKFKACVPYFIISCLHSPVLHTVFPLIKASAIIPGLYFLLLKN